MITEVYWGEGHPNVPMTACLESQCSGGDEMNRTQLQDQSRLDRPTLAATVAPVQRFCAAALAGLVVLAGVAGVSGAAQAGGKPDASAVVKQDLMNPQAYMQDLAGRMNPDGKKVLLQGVGGANTGSAAKGRATPTPPRPSNRPASSPAGKQTASPSPLMAAPKGAVTEVRNTTPPSPAPSADRSRREPRARRRGDDPDTFKPAERICLGRAALDLADARQVPCTHDEHAGHWRGTRRTGRTCRDRRAASADGPQ